MDTLPCPLIRALFLALLALAVGCSSTPAKVYQSVPSAKVSRVVLAIDNRDATGNLSQNPILFEMVRTDAVARLKTAGYAVTEIGDMVVNDDWLNAVSGDGYTHILYAHFSPSSETTKVATDASGRVYSYQAVDVPLRCSLLTVPEKKMLAQTTVNAITRGKSQFDLAMERVNPVPPEVVYAEAIEYACKSVLDAMHGDRSGT